MHGGDAEEREHVIDGIDQAVCAKGRRPGLSPPGALRAKLDPWLKSVEALGPLIDPSLHSSGTVRPDGHRELADPALHLAREVVLVDVRAAKAAGMTAVA